MIDETLNKVFKINETYDPYKIAKNKDIDILYQHLESDTLGLTVKNNRSSTILLNSRSHENLQEFVLCHELGHCFLHKTASTPFMRKYGAPSQITRMEAEANKFAFKLLSSNYEEMRYMSKMQIVEYFKLELYMQDFI